MGAKGRWNFLALAAAVLLVFACVRFSSAQLDGLEDMESPDDVSGVDCVMCHGDFAEQYDYSHSPALDGDCVLCHLETGGFGHGELTDDSRGLCLQCHMEQQYHYPAASCWISSCHRDKHGSDANELFNPSLNEQYPGFTEATIRAGYVGSDSCLGCHTEVCASWIKSSHSLSDFNKNLPPQRKGCESCHGAGSDHWGRLAGIGVFGYASVQETDSTCLKCHRDEIWVSDYEKTMHPLAGVACDSCHDPHDQTEKHNLRLDSNTLCLDCHETKRMDFNKLSSHPIDLKNPRAGMLCIECHDPHGAEGGFLMGEPVEKLCVNCHMDKGGPFVYSHPGYDPAMGNGCLTCHGYHGTNSPNLLTMNGRGLCLQCHTDRVTHVEGRNCWTGGCHTEHHGSNVSFSFFGN